MPRSVVTELLSEKEFSCQDHVFIMHGELQHPHGHAEQFVAGLRHRRQFFRRSESGNIIGLHPVKNGIPDILLAFIMSVQCRLAQPQPGGKITQVGSFVSVFCKADECRVQDLFLGCVFHHILRTINVTSWTLSIIVTKRSHVKGSHGSAAD